MNILIFSWRGPGHPYAGGAEIATHEHAKHWVKNGHNITLFTSVYKGAEKEETIDGIRVVRIGTQSFGVRVRAIIWYLRHKSDVDLVVDEFHGLPFFTPLFVGKKKLAYIHEVAKEVWRTNPWPKPFNLIPWMGGMLFEPLVFKLFYKNVPFMTVSNSTKEDLMGWGIKTKNIHIIENGVTVVGRPHAKEKTKTLMYLGALAEDKGVEDALKIFQKIYEKDKSYIFWIVGKGEKGYVESLKLKVKSLGISNCTKFFGFVSQTKKFELLARAHVLINPSIREGWGLVNIEANRMGTPVAGYNVAGIKDSVVNGKTGILVERGETEPLADKIVGTLADKKVYGSLQKEALKWSNNFSWEKSTKKSLELIENL